MLSSFQKSSLGLEVSPSALLEKHTAGKSSVENDAGRHYIGRGKESERRSRMQHTVTRSTTGAVPSEETTRLRSEDILRDECALYA